MNFSNISSSGSSNIKSLISCLCVSHNSLTYLKRAIECFLSQSYKNKELIVVYHRNRYINSEVTKYYQRWNIIFHEEDPLKDLTLGDLRNKSIEISKGSYICIWDDDDWYNEKRLELQMKALKFSKKPACLLTNLIIFDNKNSQAYYSFTRLWEGSLICKKKIFEGGLHYPSLGIDEDSPLLEKLLDLNYVYPLVNPMLYIYVFHGENTWGQEHFDNNMKMSQKLSSEFSGLIGRVLISEANVRKGSKELSQRKYLNEINYMHNPGREDFIFYPYL